MNVNRLPDYLDHMRQAIADAQSFTEGMVQTDFEQDKRTQQAVVIVVNQSHRFGRGSNKGDGPTPHICRAAQTDPLAQHAGYAQPHRPWLLRH